jgi:hypothetical protein
MKIDVEISEENIKILEDVFKAGDASEFLAIFVQELCRAVKDAKLLQQAGMEIGQKEIDDAGREAAQVTAKRVSKAVCVRCGDPIYYDLEKGWVHLIPIDNHDALPK